MAVPPSDLECEMEKVLVGDFALEHAEDLVSSRRQQGPRARGPRSLSALLWYVRLLHAHMHTHAHTHTHTILYVSQLK